MRGYVLGVVFARGGSKGLPRKNIRHLAGKPLIAYAIEAAKAAALIERVIVSTDDEEIARVARYYGAEVPFMRPAELALDDSPEWVAWQHAIQAVESEGNGRKVAILASVPTTSPLRSSADIDACVRALLEGDADAAITVTPTARNPYFNMVTLEGDYARLVIPMREAIHRRQDAPPVFDMTTVAYAARASFVQRARSLFEGKVRAIIVPAERALDIDTELDLKFAEFLLTGSAIGVQDACDRSGS